MLVLNDMTEYLEYDAEKTNEFIDDFFHVLNQHESKAEMLYSIYSRYCHNDTFVGDTATKTKLYIASHQKFLSDNHELQRAIYKKYCDIASNFSDTVDASPKARIKMSVLKKVKSDYREMSDTLEYHGRKIMNLAQELQDAFGEFGDFTIPDFHSAICEYDEFCGSSGFLDKCMNNLIEFNEWSSDTVDNSGLYDAEKHMQKKINATVNTLDSMTVYQPDIAKNSVELIALGSFGANAITNPWDNLYKQNPIPTTINLLGTNFNLKAQKQPGTVKYGTIDEHFINVYEIGDNGEKIPHYGGDQRWFANTTNEFGDIIDKNGCGVIAAVNQYLYLTGQTEISKGDYFKDRKSVV